MNSTSSRFKAWRARMGFTRDEASRTLKTSPNTIKSYELGQRNVPEKVFKLMDMLEAEHTPSVRSTSHAAIRIVGGGTVSHVRNHFALCAPAYGSTAKSLLKMCVSQGHEAELILTRMADPASRYETNEDLAVLADEIVADSKAKIIFWNPALCDFDGHIGGIKSGPKATRLKTKEGETSLVMIPAAKVVDRFRKTRKDLFLVAFKTTTNASPDEQYRAGLDLLKRTSANLVLANDTVTKLNMVVVPEEARYHETSDREEALSGLVEMALLRSQNTFTSSTVMSEQGVPWSDPVIDASLREVVDLCIKRGAYKPFNGKTVGHFAVRGPDGSIITSKRKSNFNDLISGKLDMVKIVPQQGNNVLAYGGKPSVGGMSQKIIFDEHPDAQYIVHFHCPLRENAPDKINIRDQRPNECGSHQCGKYTSDGLKVASDGILAVMLDNHGPNIVYGKDVPSKKIIDFIERNFDLENKTGGLIPV